MSDNLKNDLMRRVSELVVSQGYLPHEAIDTMRTWDDYIRERFAMHGKTLTAEQIETIKDIAAHKGLYETIDFLLSLSY